MHCNFDDERRLAWRGLWQDLQLPTEPPDDLGTDNPARVKLEKCPCRVFHTGKKHLFMSLWFHGNDWLEYQVKADTTVSHPCQKCCNTVFAKALAALYLGHGTFSNTKSEENDNSVSTATSENSFSVLKNVFTDPK